MAVSADQEHSMLHRKPRILVVGSFVMDVIATTEQIPGAGQTVYGKSFHMAPGGKGANQALQCARLGAEVTMVKFAPMGDPLELKIHGYELTLRVADAEKIEIKEAAIHSGEGGAHKPKRDISHPGLGEGGKYHEKKDFRNSRNGSRSSSCGMEHQPE